MKSLSSNLTLLVLVLFSTLTSFVKSDVIFESTAWVEVTYDTPASTLSAADLYGIETETSSLFKNAVTPSVDILLSTNVRVASVTDRGTSGQTVLDVIVTSTYIETLNSIQLDTILVQNMDKAAFTILLSSLTGAGSGTIEFTIRPHEKSAALESVLVQNGRTKADQGLVVAVSLLTIVVVTISSILLYITGGWSHICGRINNCLFMEVDEEDEYAIDKRATFQVQSYDEADDTNSGSDEPGIVSNPTMGDVENPAAGLGLQTPSRRKDEDDSFMETPSGLPLGIQSVRKMPQQTPEVPGGLSHLLLKRKQHTERKNRKNP